MEHTDEFKLFINTESLILGASFSRTLMATKMQSQKELTDSYNADGIDFTTNRTPSADVQKLLKLGFSVIESIDGQANIFPSKAASGV